ncbi:MAG: ABC transporter substrate-binding protein [Nitrospinota bacterium]
MRAKKRAGGILAACLTAGLAFSFLSFAEPAAAEKIRVTQPVDTLNLMARYVAQSKGYFAREGLEVEVVVTRGGGPDVQAVIGGHAAFSLTGGTYLVNAHVQGKPVIAVYNLVGRLTINLLIRKDVAKRRGISRDMPLARRIRAAKGLTFGATRPGAFTYLIARYLLRKGGLDPGRDVRLIGIGGPPALLAALERGRIQVMVMSSPASAAAILRGFGTYLVNSSGGEVPEMNELLNAPVLVAPSTLKRRPDLIRKFLRALDDGQKFAIEHPPEEVVPLVEKSFGRIPPKILRASIAEIRPALVPGGAITRRAVEALMDLMEAGGSLPRRIPWDRMATNRFLPR